MKFTRKGEDELLIDLNDEEVDRLRRTVARNTRSGGFQNLMREWAARLEGNRVRLVEPVLIERSIRYTSRYGDGGFQNRLGGRARYGKNGV